MISWVGPIVFFLGMLAVCIVVDAVMSESGERAIAVGCSVIFAAFTLAFVATLGVLLALHLAR